jgi:hypothetical protein
MRGVEIYRIISASAQMKQAMALNTQSKLLQNQLNLKAEQVNIQRQEANLASLEKQGRQYLVDMEFQFQRVCKINKSHPLYSLYTSEKFLREIVSSNYFQEFFRDVEDLRMVRTLAQNIEENVTQLKKKHSNLIKHEYQFFSQGLNNMHIINETLGLSDSTQKIKKQLIRRTEILKKSQNKANIFALILYPLALILGFYGFFPLFNIFSTDFAADPLCFLVPLGMVSFGFATFAVVEANSSKKKIESLNKEFQRKRNLISSNCKLLGFHKPKEMKKWVEEHGSFFAQRVPSD